MNAPTPTRTCEQCEFEVAGCIRADRLIARSSLMVSRDWNEWEARARTLIASLANDSVHALIFAAPNDRYVQMQLGHGRGRVEVSSSVTASDAGADVELIAKSLIDVGFAAPDRSLHPVSHSPNWSLDIGAVDSPMVAELVTFVVRDLMRTEPLDVEVSGFIVDWPCASCHWGDDLISA